MTFPSVQAGENLRRAAGISLLLHFLLLWPSLPQRPADDPLPALMATLRPPSAAPAAPEPARVRDARPSSSAVPAPEAKAPEPTRVPVLATPEAAASVAATVPRAEAAPVAAAPAAPKASAPSSDGSAESMRQYRLALAVEARRYRRYPPRALEAGIGGTTELRIEVADGGMPEVTLARPSGDASLDAAALEMMRKAAPRTALPEALRRRSFAVSLPIVFDPEE